MISAEIAAKQIKRLAQIKNYPRGEPEALKELTKALQLAVSEDQAKTLIAGYIEQATSETSCPYPGDIRRAIKALQEENRPDPLCLTCSGSGWRTLTRGGLSGSDRCTCWAPRPAEKIDYVPLTGSRIQ